MNFDQLAQYCQKMAYEGKEYDEIKRSLDLQSLSDEERNKILSLIDDFIVQYKLASQIKAKNQTQLLLGIIVIVIGIFILLFTFFRSESDYLIGGITTIVGLYLTKKSYDKYKAPIDIQPIIPEKDSVFRRY